MIFYIWNLVSLVLFFIITMNGYEKKYNKLYFGRSISLALLLNIPFFYFSFMTFSPGTWFGIKILDYLVPYLWAISIIYIWFKKKGILRYILLILYILTPISSMAGSLYWTYNQARPILFLLIILSVLAYYIGNKKDSTNY